MARRGSKTDMGYITLSYILLSLFDGFCKVLELYFVVIVFIFQMIFRFVKKIGISIYDKFKRRNINKCTNNKNSNNKKTSSNHSTYTEEEMDLYLLDDSQKELVRDGEYEPWSFEEDGELEEDDYYYEDDI